MIEPLRSVDPGFAVPVHFRPSLLFLNLVRSFREGRPPFEPFEEEENHD